MAHPSAKHQVRTAVVVAVWLAAACAAAEPVGFRAAVAPILVDNCLACHGPKKAEGGYRLDTFAVLRTAGDSGEDPVVPGPPPAGELLRRITAADPAERMPPDSPPLPAAAVEAIRGWVAAGAAFDGDKPTDPLPLVMPPRTHAAPASYAHPVPVTALAFTSDGSRLLVGGYHELLVFDVPDGKLVRRIGNLGQRVSAIAFLADGATVAVAGGEPGREGDVRLVDFGTGTVKTVVARTGDIVLDLAVRPGGPQLAVAAADGLVRIIDTSTATEVRTLASHADWVHAVAWSDDGTRLASASRDKSVKVHDAGSWDLLANYQDHGAAVRGVGFTPDGKQVVSAGADNRLQRWEVEGLKKVASIDLQGEGFRLVRGAGSVLVPSADRRLRSIDLANNAVARTFEGHADWPVVVAVHPGTGRIASGGLDGEVRLWNAADGGLVKAWPARP